VPTRENNLLCYTHWVGSYPHWKFLQGLNALAYFDDDEEKVLWVWRVQRIFASPFIIKSPLVLCHLVYLSFCQLDIFPTQHFSNLTFSQLNVFTTWHFPNLTFSLLDIFTTWHFPSLTFSQFNALPIWHISGSTFFQLDIFPIWHFSKLTICLLELFPTWPFFQLDYFPMNHRICWLMGKLTN